MIQEEPPAPNDPTMMGLFASIGIEKGKPFNPDARMKRILTDAANIGAVTARTIAFKIRDKDAYYSPNSTWRLPFFGGYQFLDSPGCHELGRIHFLLLFRYRRHAGDGSEDGRPGVTVSLGSCRLEGKPIRWRKSLPPAPSSQHPSERFLVSHRLRLPNALDASASGERRWVRRCLFWPESPGWKSAQLGPNNSE